MSNKAATLILVAGFSCGCARAPVVAIKAGYDFHKVGRVALLDFADLPGQAGSGQAVSQILEPYLLRAGYSLVERSQVQNVLQEQSFEQSAAVSAQGAQALGKLLSVDALVLGSVTSFTQEQSQIYMQDVSDVAYNPVYQTVQVQDRHGQVSTQQQLSHYDVSTTNEQIPTTFDVPASVAFTARLVDAATGELLWTGSTSGQGDTAAAAADGAAKRLMNALKKAWPAAKP
jgi:curli biogenesis system outer membrane secretion channel CsgG